MLGGRIRRQDACGPRCANSRSLPSSGCSRAFGFELDHDSSKRSIAHVLYGMNDRSVKGRTIGCNIHNYLRLALGPLLKASAIQLHNYALAMAMPRSRISDAEPFFENKKARPIVANRVLRGRNNRVRRLDWRMIEFDCYFKERASGGRLVRLSGFKDRYVSAGHLAVGFTGVELNISKGDDHSIAAAGRSRGCARRRVLRHANVVVFKRRLRLQEREQ